MNTPDYKNFEIFSNPYRFLTQAELPITTTLNDVDIELSSMKDIYHLLETQGIVVNLKGEIIETPEKPLFFNTYLEQVLHSNIKMDFEIVKRFIDNSDKNKTMIFINALITDYLFDRNKAFKHPPKFMDCLKQILYYILIVKKYCIFETTVYNIVYENKDFKTHTIKINIMDYLFITIDDLCSEYHTFYVKTLMEYIMEIIENIVKYTDINTFKNYWITNFIGTPVKISAVLDKFIHTILGKITNNQELTQRIKNLQLLCI